MATPSTLHLFCRIVDNFGDIGVAWRLARQLQGEHDIAVTLWVDDLSSFQKICFDIDPCVPLQQVFGVSVREWAADVGAIGPAEVADVVVEAFACDLPANYLDAMARRERKPVWINLEYLSAEPWVEDCHMLPSRHPSLPLTKYFFFPGFSARTGGLLAERSLFVRRDEFQRQPARIAAFLSSLGVQVRPGARLISLFCYPQAPVASLFSALRADPRHTVCLVPEGIATTAVTALFGRAPLAGAQITIDNLTLRILPFVEQPNYDELLWSCDLNFVRGEDSFVRAQWAAKPFVWQIYPQDEGAHHVKLEAFLARYQSDMASPAAEALSGMWRAWNGQGNIADCWPVFDAATPRLSAHAKQWAQVILENGDLASNLVQFVKEIG